MQSYHFLTYVKCLKRIGQELCGSKKKYLSIHLNLITLIHHPQLSLMPAVQTGCNQVMLVNLKNLTA